MPDTALTKTDPMRHGEEPWDVSTELLARMVEILSVIATNGKFAFAKAIEVPRPSHVKAQAQGQGLVRAEHGETVRADGEGGASSAVSLLRSTSPRLARPRVVSQ